MAFAAQNQNRSANSQLNTAPRPALKVRLQKTKLCSYHLRSACKHGSACRFAHSTAEMAEMPDLSKTRMCPDQLAGGCTNPNCQYAHQVDEIKATNFCYKTTPCMWYAMGRCRNGAQCSFAHGEEDRNPSLTEAIEDKKSQKEKQKQNTPQQRRSTDKSEPMFIRPNQFNGVGMQNSQKYLSPPGLMSMQQMGYPMSSDMSGLAPDMGAWNMGQMMPGVGYESFYNPESFYPQQLQQLQQQLQQLQHNPLMVAQASSAQLTPQSTMELSKVKSLSKYIKTLTKQVRELQNTVNQNMRSDSEQSTLSGGIGPDSGSSSNDELDEGDLENVYSQYGKVDMGFNIVDNIVDNGLMGA